MADTLALGASTRKGVKVQILSRALMEKIIINKRQVGQRIDKFLAREFF